MIPYADWDGRRKHLAVPGLLWCQSVQGTARAVLVEPTCEGIEPALDPARKTYAMCWYQPLAKNALTKAQISRGMAIGLA